MDHPTSSVSTDEELNGAAKLALNLKDEKDCNLRAAATYASREYQMVLRQHEIFRRAKTLQ